MKVAYNGCYGGFSLSREAVLLGREISGDSNWNGACIAGDKYDCGGTVTDDYGHLNSDIDRHDNILIEVIESLGDGASGWCSKLLVCEIPDGAAYEIDECDGLEDVVPPRMSW